MSQQKYSFHSYGSRTVVHLGSSTDNIQVHGVLNPRLLYPLKMFTLKIRTWYPTKSSLELEQKCRFTLHMHEEIILMFLFHSISVQLCGTSLLLGWALTYFHDAVLLFLLFKVSESFDSHSSWFANSALLKTMSSCSAYLFGFMVKYRFRLW